MSFSLHSTYVLAIQSIMAAAVVISRMPGLTWPVTVLHQMPAFLTPQEGVITINVPKHALLRPRGLYTNAKPIQL